MIDPKLERAVEQAAQDAATVLEREGRHAFSGAIRALLAAYEEQGRENERLRASDAGWAKAVADAVGRWQQAEAKMARVVEAAGAAQCGCTLLQRESGHLVECWKPNLEAALTPAEIREERSIRKGEAEMQEGRRKSCP